MIAKKKLALAVGAGLASLVAANAANAAFTVSIVSSGINVGGFDYYNIGALNTGGDTGTKLGSVNATITTAGANGVPGTGGIVFQLSDLDGDGSVDANVLGSGLTATSTAGSWIRAGSFANFTALAVTPSQTSTDPGGTGSKTQSIDSAYTSGTVHSFNVQGFVTVNNGVAASATPAVFAHVVVPTGIAGIVNYSLFGDAGLAQPGAISFGAVTPPPTPSSTTVTLTAAATNTSVGSITANRSAAGGFTPRTTTFAASVAGSLGVSGFTATDIEAYGLDLYLNGVQTAFNSSTANANIATAAAAAINANSSSGVHAFYIGAPANAFEQSLARALSPSGDDIVVYSTTAAGVPAAPTSFNGFLNFDFTGFNAANSGSALSVAAVTVVPEPVSIAGLAVGAAGLLLGRRKRAA